jgi:hypothetical protein
MGGIILPAHRGPRLILEVPYTLRLTNTGDAHLHAVITETLPAHVQPTGVLTWTPPAICPGAPWTQTVVVTVEMGYGGPLSNEVEVATREGATGEASVTVHVEARRIYLPLVFKDWGGLALIPQAGEVVGRARPQPSRLPRCKYRRNADVGPTGHEVSGLGRTGR